MPNGLESLGVSDAEIREILASPEVTAKKLDLAEKVKAYWKAIAPVRTGHYRDSIHIAVGTDQVVRIIAEADYSSEIEYGTGGDSPTPEFACRSIVEARFAERG
jgi:hypothetical protein